MFSDSKDCYFYVVFQFHQFQQEISAPALDWMTFSFQEDTFSDHPNGVSPCTLLQAPFFFPVNYRQLNALDITVCLDNYHHFKEPRGLHQTQFVFYPLDGFSWFHFFRH